jgi:rubrerythrin
MLKSRVNGNILTCGRLETPSLAELENAFLREGTKQEKYRYGYALASHKGLIEISNQLRAASESELDALRQLLRIGVHWNVQVTIDNCKHEVSQAYYLQLSIVKSRYLATYRQFKLDLLI